MNDEKAVLTQYDDLLKDDAEIAAIVIRERLRPVNGPRGVFFPPTFAGIGQGRKSDYHIVSIGPRADDPEGASRDGLISNTCTVDSVPSQANRLESRLLRYSGKYIPKVTISGSQVGQPSLDLLEVGHRVADAVLRYTANDGYKQFRDALSSFVKGDSGPLARLAPTSLVFGHWDSRPGGTKSKARRILRSEIVAYNVARSTKRSQYWSSIDPEVNEELGQILKEAKEAASKDPESKNPASQLGMTDVPAPESPGGAIAFGKIERTSMIALSGLRSMVAASPKGDVAGDVRTQQAGPVARVPSADTGEDDDRNSPTSKLRRYLFALSLAAITDTREWDLREGCILVRNGPPPFGDLGEAEPPMTITAVGFDGKEADFTVPGPIEVENYLKASADAFFGNEFPAEKPLVFAPKLAKAAVTEPKTKKDFVAALKVLPEYTDKEKELDAKRLPDLKKLWKDKLSPGEADRSEDKSSQTES